MSGNLSKLIDEDMTFEEFRKLALTPPYIEQECVYRVDVHCNSHFPWERLSDKTQYKVRLTESFIYLSLDNAENKMKELIERPGLYATYIYQLPIGKNISYDLYQRLWVYDRFGNLNGQSCCTAMKEDLNHPSAKFRGHDANSIRFKPGDIVEIYNRETESVHIAIVTASPLTIDQCWKEHVWTEEICKKEGRGYQNVDENYPLYDTDNGYFVIFDPDHSVPKHAVSYNVFKPQQPISENVSNQLNDYFQQYNDNLAEANKTMQYFIDHLHSLYNML